MVRKRPVGGDGTLRLFVHSGSPPVPSPSKTRSHQVPNPSPVCPVPSPILPKRARFPSKSQISLLNISTIWNWWRETLPSATLKVQNFHNVPIGSVAKLKYLRKKHLWIVKILQKSKPKAWNVKTMRFQMCPQVACPREVILVAFL